MHTLNTVKLSLGDVQMRIDAADKIVREKAKAIVERHYRRGPAPVALDDMDKIKLPEVSTLPFALYAVAVENDLLFCDKPQRRPYKYDVANRCALSVTLDPKATPEQLVAAIKAADERAALYTALDAEYTEATKAAIAEHVKAQHGACLELVGLCAQVG